MSKQKDLLLPGSGTESSVPVPYTIKRTRRKTLGLYVHASGKVEVRVPHFARLADIEHFVFQNRSWVSRKLRELPTLVPDDELAKTAGFCAGATHYLHGEAFTLQLENSAKILTSRHSVRLDTNPGQLRVSVDAQHDANHVKDALIHWYKNQALAHFENRLEQCLPRLAHFRVAKPLLKIRRMRTRWGSCSSKGNINLNLWLLRVPVALQDYVITHELSHLIELNHSPRFYSVMDHAMPDWRQRRRQLRHHPAANLSAVE